MTWSAFYISNFIVLEEAALTNLLPATPLKWRSPFCFRLYSSFALASFGFLDFWVNEIVNALL